MKPGVTSAPSASITSRAGPSTCADRDDAAVLDRDIAGAGARAGAVDDAAVADQDVVHPVSPRGVCCASGAQATAASLVATFAPTEPERTSRPGRAPVSSSLRRVMSPLTIVAR